MVDSVPFLIVSEACLDPHSDRNYENACLKKHMLKTLNGGHLIKISNGQEQ